MQKNQIKEIKLSACSVKYISNADEVVRDQIEALRQAPNTDLIVNVQEGGLKVWECTVDLLNQLDDIIRTDADASSIFKGKTVLDLGCGHGLLGIQALQNGADRVVFQDFNGEVLEQVTKANVVMNLNEDTLTKKCHFISGDWSDFCSRQNNQINAQFNDTNMLVENEGYQDQKQNTLNNHNSSNNGSFDVILTSEVIYNQENYFKFTQLIYQCLNSQGVCQMANKLYQQGVGGSVFEYKQHLEEQWKDKLQIASTFLVNSKKGNKREIMQLVGLKGGVL